MKIYTRTGDSGETGLFGGRRVSKGDPRVEAYGSVDELNAQIGWALTLLDRHPIQSELRQIQADLFALGSDLATPGDAPSAAAARASGVQDSDVRRLEALIDRWEAEVRPLRNFILPGGASGAAALQVCRAVCRRAERELVRLSATESVAPHPTVCLNRLADLLSVLSRGLNAREGADEPIWKGSGG